MPDSKVVKRAIRESMRNHPLGTGTSVMCHDCNGNINEGENVKAYIIGNHTGINWKVSRVFHEDCGTNIFVPERIGNSDETEALGFGEIVHDPSVSAGGPDEMQTYEDDDISFITSERGVHRIENPNVEKYHIMGDDRLEEKKKAIREGKEIIEQIRSGELSSHPLARFIQKNNKE